MSRYPYVDRNPCILAAGKPNRDLVENVKELFENVTLEDKIDVLKRQLRNFDTQRFCRELSKLPDPDSFENFTEIRHCLRKPEPTHFQELDEEIKTTIYDSYWNKPLGKSRDPTPNLPKGMRPEEITFGIKVVNSEPAGCLINPRVPAELIEEESKICHELYTFTHNNYYPGEKINREYSAPFCKDDVFGKITTRDDSGAKTKRCLTWFNNDPLSHVSRRQAAVRNRTLPPLGKSLDKTGVTDKLPSNYTFGLPGHVQFYGVEELLNECPRSTVRKDMLTFLACANRLRQLVYSKINLGEITLKDLYDEIMQLKKDKKKSEEKEQPDCPTLEAVQFDCLVKIMKRHNIILDKSKLEPLLLILGLMNTNGEIKVVDFIKFIDKNSRFPLLKKEHYVLPVEYQQCRQKDIPESRNSKNLYKVICMPPAGLPTFRLDKPLPVYDDVLANIDNLGQETTARTVISPSIYTQYGLTHRDFLKPRSKEFLCNLFKKIDVTLSEEEFDQIYNEGCALDKTGAVCVETFRNLLDERAYKAFKRN